MEVIKSSRFWILLVIVAGAILLGALGKATGDQVMGLLGGLLAGFGVGKVPGSKATSSNEEAGFVRLGSIALAGILAALMWLSVAMFGCSGPGAQGRHDQAAGYATAAQVTACVGVQLTCDLMERKECVESVKKVCAVAPELLKAWLAATKPAASTSP